MLEDEEYEIETEDRARLNGHFRYRSTQDQFH